MNTSTPASAAVGPGAENTALGVELGARWVLNKYKEHGGRILVLLPTMPVLQEHPGLEALARRPEVAVGTKRNGIGAGANIILAAWPTEDAFAAALRSRRDGVCILPWQNPKHPLAWVTAWAMATNAEQLMPVRPVASAPDLDPVVKVALDDIADLGDFGTLGRGLRKSTVKVLADAGYALPPDDVQAHLIAAGLPMASALEVGELARRVSNGVRLRAPSVGTLDGDALARWRREAKA